MVDYYNCKMSGSEDELEPQPQNEMSKAELRRSNKPIMEKRRRARINQCLDELKSLILEAMKKDPSRHSKLEKADILEMTVKHLQTIQRQQLGTAVSTDPATLSRFRNGFSECATEVSRYVNHLENVEPAVKKRLMNHLNSCVTNLQQVPPFYSHYVPYVPERLYPDIKVGFPSDYQNGDENNNGSARIQIPSGVQLISSRLISGELALLVPQSSTYPIFPQESGTSRGTQPSAFTAVQRSRSPLVSPTTSSSSFEDTHHPEPQSPRNRFKIPDCNSKSYLETQKAQVSSSSDRKSPNPEFKVREPGDLEDPCHPEKLRQPLSVITDKTCNNIRASAFVKRNDLKRKHSEGLLGIVEKRQRVEMGQFMATTSGGFGERRVTEKGVEDLSGRNEERRCQGEGGSGVVSGDMWRPW